ncbi:Hypothetical protein SRAE_0000070100 [Strongyloides ratti]|uniref:Uncharacterized protein n=1 Tax=Strongyloides ratti TaxID=34506 RepID=A0A090MTD6_STRRB|nr:Hypothetical protein SRAE_0000070100 [Strongyloides ratti]CEF61583.1 Hypothetical protein SRAE_0000070100 [Strongyloides ratti]
MNAYQLYKDIPNETAAIKYLQKRGLIPETKECENGHKMKLSFGNLDPEQVPNKLSSIIQPQNISYDTSNDIDNIPLDKINLPIESDTSPYEKLFIYANNTFSDTQERNVSKKQIDNNDNFDKQNKEHFYDSEILTFPINTDIRYLSPLNLTLAKNNL